MVWLGMYELIFMNRCFCLVEWGMLEDDMFVVVLCIVIFLCVLVIVCCVYFVGLLLWLGFCVLLNGIVDFVLVLSCEGNVEIWFVMLR